MSEFKTKLGRALCEAYNRAPSMIPDFDALGQVAAEFLMQEAAIAASRPDVSGDEREHCENVVGQLADAEGLVVITSSVVALVEFQRAAAFAAGEANGWDKQNLLKIQNVNLRAALEAALEAMNDARDTLLHACGDAHEALK